MEITIPTSIGELVDKLTILNIKLENVTNREKKENLVKEKNKLQEIYDNLNFDDEIDQFFNQLMTINKKLWNIEDEIRILERNKQFDEKFIKLARSVYITNDESFSIKNKINNFIGSNIKEEKLYQKYN